MIVVFMTVIMSAMAQEKIKEIHFLADTVNVVVNNRIVEIGQEGGLPYFAFYCKCIAPYSSIVSFANYKKDVSPVAVEELPAYNFMAWKDFSDIISREGTNINKTYSVYITEVLPKHKYRTYKVKLVIGRDKTIDDQVIKNTKY